MNSSNTSSKSANLSAAQSFGRAEALFAQDALEEALAVYEECRRDRSLASICYYRMGEILNTLGRLDEALSSHRKVFELDPAFAKMLLDPKLSAASYVYVESDEVEVPHCPVCDSGDHQLHSVYNCLTDLSFVVGFHPIRQWRKCGECSTLFASHYPKNLGDVLASSAPPSILSPKVNRFVAIARIMRDLLAYAPETTLLEVGVGAGEFSAVAQEMGFEVTGLDIRPAYAEAVAKRYGFPVHVVDFLDYSASQKYGVIAMGDVLEHFISPMSAIEKALSLLADDGVLWISTPNYESAFAKSIGTKDPMWRTCQHLTYFSRASLEKCLKRFGLSIVHYMPSASYNGSMEVIAKRT